MLTIMTVPWIVLQTVTNTITYAKRSPYISSIDQPDATKAYSKKTNLYASRVFKPAGSAMSPLPLVIRIHGGGFVMNNPAGDDNLSRFLADEVPSIVVSLDHSKSPRHVFPEAYEDLIEQSLAAIRDEELDVDPQKVVIFGISSGGNLALAIAQDERLKSKLRGVMALTPMVDFVTPLDEKMASRPDPGVPDFLAGMYSILVPLYLGHTGQSLEDVRISPSRFGDRKELPEHVYLIGAEHGLLCREAELMAEKLAGNEPRRRSQRMVGRRREMGFCQRAETWLRELSSEGRVGGAGKATGGGGISMDHR